MIHDREPLGASLPTSTNHRIQNCLKSQHATRSNRCQAKFQLAPGVFLKVVALEPEDPKDQVEG